MFFPTTGSISWNVWPRNGITQWNHLALLLRDPVLLSDDFYRWNEIDSCDSRQSFFWLTSYVPDNVILTLLPKPYDSSFWLGNAYYLLLQIAVDCGATTMILQPITLRLFPNSWKCTQLFMSVSTVTEIATCANCSVKMTSVKFTTRLIKEERKILSLKSKNKVRRSALM